MDHRMHGHVFPDGRDTCRNCGLSKAECVKSELGCGTAANKMEGKKRKPAATKTARKG